MPQQQLDPQAIALSKAIRDVESHGDFNAKGKSGEWGAYQFMPDTWTAYAKEAGVNAAFGSASPDQQNEVAYRKIKQWKDQGRNVGEIASMWNAGPGKSNAYLEGNKGVNSFGVEYDTKAYAEKVAQAYQRMKGDVALGRRDAPVPQLGQQIQNKGFIASAGDSLAEAGGKVANAIGDTLSQKINPVSGLIRGAGGVLGAVGDLTTDVLEHTPVVKDVYKGAENLVGSIARGAAESDAGQDAIRAYTDFAQRHPELAGNIGAGVDIATGLPLLKGLKTGVNSVKGAVNTALHGKTDDVLEAVSPALTPKRMAEAIETRGVEKKGLLRDIAIKPDPYDVKVADAVKSSVAGFNPNKPFIDNISATQTVVGNMAKQLKQKVNELGKDRIYSYRELAANLNAIERPLLIATDTTLNNAYNRVIAKAIEIAKKKGGKVPALLDTRQEFDQFVRKQFPNLYSSDTLTPMRQAIKDVRNAITDFTVKNLPEGAGLKESLLTQHQLITAIENMAEKASKGAGKEIGTNAFERQGLTKGLFKEGLKLGANSIGLGAAVKIMD